jgi:hypothetical protein
MIVIRSVRERRKKHLSPFETSGIDHAKRIITIAKACDGAARRRRVAAADRKNRSEYSSHSLSFRLRCPSVRKRSAFSRMKPSASR